jgi:hypothetical protein
MVFARLVAFFFFSILGVCCNFILLLYFALFLLVACFGLKKILRIERHLAAKFGTFLRVLNTRGRLY